MTQLQCELANLKRAIKAPPAAPSNRQIIRVLISCAAIGDNTLIPAPSRDLEILEIFIWNGVTAQTLALRDGLTVIWRQTATPIGGGFFAGFAGANQPHFLVSAGNPFVLVLAAAAQVDGFINYRLVQ